MLVTNYLINCIYLPQFGRSSAFFRNFARKIKKDGKKEETITDIGECDHH